MINQKESKEVSKDSWLLNNKDQPTNNHKK